MGRQTQTSGERILHSWSSGKDSAVALAKARELGHEIEALITVVRNDERVSVHAVRRELLRSQAEALGLPLIEVLVTPENPYEKAVSETLTRQGKNGISKVCYGDLFLEDIKIWRDRFHAAIGFECLYPIWKMDTTEFARDFIASGRKAVITCVDTKRLDFGFAGRDYDEDFIRDLPDTVDPCGENGEFHTFVYDGPEFAAPIEFRRSKPTLREFDDPGHRFTFGFCDLLPI